MPGRQYAGTNEYRFGFNGKEKDDEVKGSNNSLDFGARIYDPRVGRWMSTDPFQRKYPSLSPYNFVGNMPIIAIDPDGKKILFVNGYNAKGVVGSIIGSSSGGKKYWGIGFSKAAQNFFKDYSKIGSSNYLDGSSQWGGDMSGAERYDAGYGYAKDNIEVLTADMVKGETFKMVTHSEGAAYGAGVAAYLLEQGYEVETIVHLSADEGDEFSTPEQPTTYQMGYDGDWITGNKGIDGVDKSGVVDREDLGPLTIHGSTKGKGVFKELNDLITVGTQDNLNENGQSYKTQQKGTTSNGTNFSEVNGDELK